MTVLALVCLAACSARPATAQVPAGFIYTAVGGSNGDGGPATDAVVDPRGVAACVRLPSLPADFYVADGKGNRVRKIDGVTGMISTVAGTGVAGFSGDGGSAVEAHLNFPVDVACDANGNLYVAENRRVRKVDSTGRITTIAGNGSPEYSGDNGLATQAGLTTYAVAIDANGTLYVADADNRRVRKVDVHGTITTVAGTGVLGYAREGETAATAALGFPNGVAVDIQGRLYIVDYNNKVVYRVTNGTINTFAGNYIPSFGGDGFPALNASLLFPNRVAVDALGNVYIADHGNNRVRRVDVAGIINTVAGNGNIGSTGDGGPGPLASLFPIRAVAADHLGNVYIATSVSTADVWSPDNRVRRLNAAGVITTAVGMSDNGNGGPATAAVVDPAGLAAEHRSGPQDLYIADSRNNQVRRVDAVSGKIANFAGIGTAGFSGDDGLAVNAQLSGPSAVAVDPSGNVYIGDLNNFRVRRVDTRGVITTIAGSGIFGYSGEGGVATNAALSSPIGLAVDNNGTLYIADRYNHRVRKVSQGVITTVAGNGTFDPLGVSGDGNPATQAQVGVPTDVVVAPDGSLYIAENGNHRVRKVRSNGIIITVAGSANFGSSGDGGLAVNALLNAPYRLALDAQGNVFVSDFSNNRVRRVDIVSGIITTVAGTGTGGVEGDGGPATLANLYGATGLAVDAASRLHIAQAASARVRVVADIGSATQPPPPTYTPTSLPSPTSTPTRTATPTVASTLTPTRTPTVSPTRTPTPSLTWTATRTATPTHTPTATRTPTVTHTQTFTPSPSRTATTTPTSTATLPPTATRTPTTTRTNTPTATPTVTRTATATATSTRTATPTFTSSPIPTHTLTASPSPTVTHTATRVPTHTPTATRTATAPPTHTASPSRTVTHTATRVPTHTPTATRTATAPPTHTASPSRTVTHTATRVPTHTPTATRTATPTATAPPTHTATPTATRTRTPTLTTTPSHTPTRTPTTTATPSSTSTPVPTSTVTPSATRSATATPTHSATATATGTPSATATHTTVPTHTRTSTPTATMTTTGDCGGDGTVTVNELLAMVNISLGTRPLDTCPAGDANGDGDITVNEIVIAVNHAL